jgi:uncharacterized protein (DUF1778 family)
VRTSRPRKPNRTIKYITLRMSEQEYDIILAAAEEADRSLNNYVMRAVLNQARIEEKAA